MIIMMSIHFTIQQYVRKGPWLFRVYRELYILSSYIGGDYNLNHCMDPYWTSSIMGNKRFVFRGSTVDGQKLSIHHINWWGILSMNRITGEFISHAVLDLFTSPSCSQKYVTSRSFRVNWGGSLSLSPSSSSSSSSSQLLSSTLLSYSHPPRIFLQKNATWFFPQHEPVHRKRVVALSSFARCLKDGASPCHWSGPQSLGLEMRLVGWNEG